jgi:hypothetical protein
MAPFRQAGRRIGVCDPECACHEALTEWLASVSLGDVTL